MNWNRLSHLREPGAGADPAARKAQRARARLRVPGRRAQSDGGGTRPLEEEGEMSSGPEEEETEQRQTGGMTRTKRSGSGEGKQNAE